MKQIAIPPTELTTVFGNLWSNMQDDKASMDMLCNTVETLVNKYEPDVMGFNEVVADNPASEPRLKNFLTGLGYHVEFVPFGPEKGRYPGNAIATKQKPLKVTKTVLCRDMYPIVRSGSGEHFYQSLHTEVQVGDHEASVSIVDVHLPHIVPYNWLEHIKAVRNLKQIIYKPDTSMIVGGDFNQFKFMTGMFGLTKGMNRATGSLGNPTWRLNGVSNLVKANYDNILSTSSGIDLVDFAVHGGSPSDHNFIVAKHVIHKANTIS